MTRRACRTAALIALLPAAAAAWVMAPAFGPGAALPFSVPPLVWAACRATRGRRWAAVLAIHLGLVPAAVLLALIPPPLPTLAWGALVWVFAPLILLMWAGGESAGLLHGLLWIATVWSAWGVLVSRGSGGA